MQTQETDPRIKKLNLAKLDVKERDALDRLLREKFVSSADMSKLIAACDNQKIPHPKPEEE